VHTGVSFTTFAVNVPRYLGYLLSLVRAHNGVTIPARLPTVAGLEKALAEAKRLVGGREAWAYVNASGIGAKELCGDDTVYALRGQTVLVRGEAKAISTRLGKTANEVRAIIPRPGSGTTIVGVSKEPGVWSTTVSEEMTRSLLEGGRELAPELVDERDGTFGVKLRCSRMENLSSMSMGIRAQGIRTRLVVRARYCGLWRSPRREDCS
jgi:D-amino-acid oxidase